MRFSDRFESIYKRILPSPFTIAILLTMLTFILALVFTKPQHEGFWNYSITLMGKWEAGLWNESTGGLYFAFQMMLMLFLGHVIALSKPVDQFIRLLTNPCTNSANTAFIVTLSTLIVSFFNWGLGLVFGAILARKIGEKFGAQHKSLNYPLIGAAAYSGLMVWHGGLSGSAPLKANEPGNLQNLVATLDGVNLNTIPSSVSLSETLFSSMNIFVTLLVLIALPLIMYLLGKRQFKDIRLPQPIKSLAEPTEKATGMERLEYIRVFSSLIGLIIIFYAIYKAFVLPDKLSLNFLTPNFINFCLLGLSLIFHSSITKFLAAADEAIKGTTGILLQFPLYFGIMGLMIGSGLINHVTDFFVDISSSNSYPLYTFFSAGLINIFVPSGGGQWAVQGPIIISAAQELNVNYGKAIMAMAYGDQLTNMIQPFWALPLLGITGLKAKEILPYTLVIMASGILIFVAALVLF